MKYLLIFTVFSFCSVVHVSDTFAAGITRAVMLSNSCAACHGTDGKSPGAIPAIYGKSSQFISQSLREFREGKRPATVMGRHASGYTDEEIQLIADYFSSQR
jgi:sulfide dehydrogenase cytochrome subunit